MTSLLQTVKNNESFLGSWAAACLDDQEGLFAASQSHKLQYNCCYVTSLCAVCLFYRDWSARAQPEELRGYIPQF